MVILLGNCSSAFNYASFSHTSYACLSLVIQGKYAAAGCSYERCQAIEEKVLGPDHRELATTLNNRAGLLRNVPPPL